MMVSGFRRKTFVLTGMLAMLSVACSKKDEDESKTESSTIGALAIKPTDVFESVGASLKGLGEGMAAMGGTSLRLDGEGPFSCNEETNEPVDNKDATKNTQGGDKGPWLPETDPRYGTFKLACILSGSADNSTTISGSFELPRVFGCALSSMTDLAFDGVTRDVKIPVTKACFGALVESEDTGIKDGDEIPAKLTLTKPSDVAGWDYSMHVETDGSEFIMHFAGDLAKSVAFAIYQKGQQPWGDDGVSLAMNFETGEIRYVYRRDITNCDDKTGADLETCFGSGDANEGWEGTSNLALLAKGSFNADQEFTLTDIHGAHTRVYASGTETARTHTASTFTLSGNLTEGATQRSYSTSAATSLADFKKASSFPENESHILCFKHEQDPTTGACDGNDGVKLKNDEDTVFMIHPADDRHPRNKEWVANAPLDFDSIDLSDTIL